MNTTSYIRNGHIATANVPRNQFRKLWNWCLKNSSDGTVGVRVYRSSDYGVKWDKSMKRIGRATPTVRIHPRFDMIRERYVIGYSTISWSYVY